MYYDDYTAFCEIAKQYVAAIGGIVLDNDSCRFDTAIINQIQSLVLAGTEPCDVLRHLAEKVVDKDEFVGYMMKAFPEADGDMWVVASRWIK